MGNKIWDFDYNAPSFFLTRLPYSCINVPIPLKLMTWGVCAISFSSVSGGCLCVCARARALNVKG